MVFQAIDLNVLRWIRGAVAGARAAAAAEGTVSAFALVGGVVIVIRIIGGVCYWWICRNNAQREAQREEEVEILVQQNEQAEVEHFAMRAQLARERDEANQRAQAFQEAHRLEREAQEQQRRELNALQEELQSLQEDLQSLREARRPQQVEYPVPEWLINFFPNAQGNREFLNIGIVGGSGVGKSLLVNKLRGFSSREDVPEGQRWAPTGVSETTVIPTPYELPLDNVQNYPIRALLWDLPGVGTPRFPQEDYFRTVGLRHFDFVIVVSSDRFTENDLILKEELQRLGRSFAFVRTKIDIAVSNNEQDNNVPEEATVAQIRDDIRAQGIMNPILVASRGPNPYDLPVLVETVQNELHAS